MNAFMVSSFFSSEAYRNSSENRAPYSIFTGTIFTGATVTLPADAASFSPMMLASLSMENTKISLPLKATGIWAHSAAREDLPVTLLNRSATTSSGNMVPLL